MAREGVNNWRYLTDALVEWFNELAAGGIFMTDADLRIQAWNRWLEGYLGRRAADIIGVPLFEAFPELVTRGLDQYYRDALAGQSRVVAHRFHGYLLAVPIRPGDPAAELPQGLMPQSARIAPLRLGGRVVGTITVIENVTERVMSERELRSQIALLERARATAEAAVRTKDEFLATLSHELRTPLNAVLGWTRLMRSGQLDQSTFGRALDVVDRNASAQAQLIDDILDVARIMQGKLRLEMQATDTVPLVLAAVDVIRPAAEAKRLTLTTRLDADSALVTGDPNRLQQVIWNLLSNAVKFTEPGGVVDVHLQVDEKFVEIRVTDTGKGITGDFLPHVFDRFRQEDSTTTRKYGGLGLGLSLVRQLVDLHGGRVYAESAGEGKGSTFVVRVPLRSVQLMHGASPSRSSGHSDSQPLAGRFVLLVDDEADARDVLGASLTGRGARVVAVSSAAEAYSTLTSPPDGQRPELIVADIGMPDEDGYTLMQRIRALPHAEGGDIPAVAVTGYARPEDRDRAIECGYQVQLAKPVDPEDLTRTVLSLLAERNPAIGRA